MLHVHQRLVGTLPIPRFTSQMSDRSAANTQFGLLKLNWNQSKTFGSPESDFASIWEVSPPRFKGVEDSYPIVSVILSSDHLHGVIELGFRSRPIEAPASEATSRVLQFPRTDRPILSTRAEAGSVSCLKDR